MVLGLRFLEEDDLFFFEVRETAERGRGELWVGQTSVLNPGKER